MVHPWVTIQGTAPLVPYNEPLHDEQLWDKVQSYAAKLDWGLSSHYIEESLKVGDMLQHKTINSIHCTCKESLT